MKVNFDTFIQALDGIDDSFILEAADDSAVKAAFKKENKRAVNIRFTLKRLMLVAVVLVGMVAMGMVAGSRLSGVDAVVSFGDRMHELDVGESTEWHGTLIVKVGHNNEYETVEEFYEKTEYDVMYPSVMPQGFYLDFILTELGSSIGAGEKTYRRSFDFYDVRFVTNDPLMCSVLVQTHPSWQAIIRNDKNLKKETVNGFECYIFDDDYHMVAGCYLIHEDITYTIQAPTREEVITIINGMKKYEQ